MSNLLVIVAAKLVLLAIIATFLRLSPRILAAALAAAVPIGTVFGLAFFGLFYVLVPAIGYRAEVTPLFVAANAMLSYGATAATVALLPISLETRAQALPLGRERVYFGATTAVAALAIVLSQSTFVQAFSIGVILISGTEVLALAARRTGLVSLMLHGRPRPLAMLLATTALLGIFYETLNLAFPVWTWLTLDPFPEPARIAIMMAVGYIVLIHPMFVVLRLVVGPPAGLGQRSS